MTTHTFNLDTIHPSWKNCVSEAITKVDASYLADLSKSTDWLPGPDHIFSAFSLPVEQVNYVLFGESPYPRKESANGFAFWDNAVNELWSDKGLSKQVNRATSLRNIIKMLLLAEGLLPPNATTQDHIAGINKSTLIKTNAELFQHLLQHGFLLLNATPVLQAGPPAKDARAWLPFTQHVLHFILKQQPDVRLILFGKIAQTIDDLLAEHDACQGTQKLCSEHPYNISFINNPAVIAFFQPLHLLVSNY